MVQFNFSEYRFLVESNDHRWPAMEVELERAIEKAEDFQEFSRLRSYRTPTRAATVAHLQALEMGYDQEYALNAALEIYREQKENWCAGRKNER